MGLFGQGNGVRFWPKKGIFSYKYLCLTVNRSKFLNYKKCPISLNFIEIQKVNSHPEVTEYVFSVRMISRKILPAQITSAVFCGKY